MDKEEMKKKLRRPAGALLILLSAVEAKFFMLDVLDKFRAAHESTISYSEKGIFLPPLTLMLGLLMLVTSDSQIKMFQTEERKLTPAGWILVVAMLAVSFGTAEWFKGEVKKLGYVSSDTMELRPVENKSTNDGEPDK